MNLIASANAAAVLRNSQLLVASVTVDIGVGVDISVSVDASSADKPVRATA